MKYQMLQLDSVMHAQIDKILEHYGANVQSIKACEELTELLNEIFHLLPDGSPPHDNFISEVADVYIMLEQVVRMYKIDPEDIRAAMVKKLRRTEDNIIKEGLRNDNKL